VRDETRGFKSLICPTAKAENFCAKGWTGNSADLPVGQNSPHGPDHRLKRKPAFTFDGECDRRRIPAYDGGVIPAQEANAFPFMPPECAAVRAANSWQTIRPVSNWR
jgi:hypothetical protein